MIHRIFHLGGNHFKIFEHFNQYVIHQIDPDDDEDHGHFFMTVPKDSQDGQAETPEPIPDEVLDFFIEKVFTVQLESYRKGKLETQRQFRQCLGLQS